MKISELSSEPKLIPIEIKSDSIVEKYGEAITFHIYDRQPLDVFAKLAAGGEDNVLEIATVIESMILNEDGSSVVEGKNSLPVDVLMEAMALISEALGK